MIRANLFERILLGVAALAVLVLLFFFLAAALVLGSIVVTALLVRYWWFKRSIRRPGETDPITTEYTVIERERDSQPRLPDEDRTDSSKETP